MQRKLTKEDVLNIHAMLLDNKSIDFIGIYYSVHRQTVNNAIKLLRKEGYEIPPLRRGRKPLTLK